MILRQIRFAILTLLFIGTAIATGIIGGVLVAITRDLPQVRELENYAPSSTTRIYSADRVILAELFTERREPTPINKIPKIVRQAVLAIEDKQFYQHPGVDVRGVLRALARDVAAGAFVEGASTITQQLSRSLFLTPERNIVRKIREAFLSFQIERRYTKDEIFELYLNQVYFGSGAYGVAAAAKVFFGKTLKELTLEEAALIAGMPKSPSRYSPLVNPTVAMQRRNIVLNQLRKGGVISRRRFEEALRTPVRLRQGGKFTPTKAPYFVDYVKRFLNVTLPDLQPYRSGLTINTTLNIKLQDLTEKVVSEGITQLEERLERDDGLSPNAAFVSLDVKTGAILSMAGGTDYKQSQFNRATMAARQPGSAFKPLIYALAIEKGLRQNDIIWDSPISFRGARPGEYWIPQNYTEKFEGKMTLRQALTVSQNIPAVKLAARFGPVTVAKFAQRLGIESHLAPNMSLALGSSAVTLLELTSAYAAFPNGGIWNKPCGIAEVIDRNGRVIWKWTPQQRAVLSPEAAAIITDMLTGVVQDGTARAARSLGRPVAGKTGTTDNFRDALFIGFSPTIAAGIRVGMDQNVSLGEKETGGRTALPFWIKYMEQALSTEPIRDFSLPPGVERVYVDKSSGLLASTNCPKAIREVFRINTGPKVLCGHGGIPLAMPGTASLLTPTPKTTTAPTAPVISPAKPAVAMPTSAD